MFVNGDIVFFDIIWLVKKSYDRITRSMARNNNLQDREEVGLGIRGYSRKDFPLILEQVIHNFHL